MSSFPLCIDLTGQRVLLVGNGPEIREKQEKLAPFGPDLVFLPALTAGDLTPVPALVVAGDLEDAQARLCSRLCRERNVPVNVVDRPELCTFFFPALIRRGDLTIAVSTSGKSPSAAACLRRRIEQQLPDTTEQILEWLDTLRHRVRTQGTRTQRRDLLNAAAAEAFSRGAPLPEDALKGLIAAYFGPGPEAFSR